MKVLILVVVVAVVIETTSACDCDHRKGGCHIVSQARPGMACKCVYKGFWTCVGHQVGCTDQNHDLCQNPNMSREACEFANGDCGGYRG